MRSSKRGYAHCLPSHFIAAPRETLWGYKCFITSLLHHFADAHPNLSTLHARTYMRMLLLAWISSPLGSDRQNLELPKFPVLCSPEISASVRPLCMSYLSSPASDRAARALSGPLWACLICATPLGGGKMIEQDISPSHFPTAPSAAMWVDAASSWWPCLGA